MSHLDLRIMYSCRKHHVGLAPSIMACVDKPVELINQYRILPCRHNANILINSWDLEQAGQSVSTCQRPPNGQDHDIFGDDCGIIPVDNFPFEVLKLPSRLG